VLNKMKTSSSDYDPTMVQRTLSLIHAPGDVIEIRLPETGPTKVVSGYFDDVSKLLAALKPFAQRANVESIYFTLNQINPALLARSANEFKTYAKLTTSDADVVWRTTLGLDFDPRRPTKISSSDEEHKAALQQAQRCRTWLSAMGWPEPIVGDSGNGGHLAYRIDLPNDGEARDLIKHVLEALDLYHSTEIIVLDLSVFNAARVWKLFGTMARKASNIPARPHRLARILDAPESLSPVTREQLIHVADMAPPQESSHTLTHTAHRNSGRTLDVGDWLQRHGITVRRQKVWKNGTLYELATCPWNAEHANGEARVIQLSSGAIHAGCFHNSCANKSWQDLREQHEPQHRRTSITTTARASHGPLPKSGAKVNPPKPPPDDRRVPVEAPAEASAEREAIREEPPSDEYHCPDNLWIGIYADVAKALNKKSWEIWTGTTAALGAVAQRQIDTHYHGALYGMVYLLLVKPTGLGKAECTNTCRGLLPEEYIARDVIQSGQALAPILAEIIRDKKDRVTDVRPRPAILIMDEWTALLHSAGIANSTIVDTINGLFHRQFPWNVSRSDRAGSGGDLVIKQPTLTICATATVSLLKRCVNEGMIRSGFLNRHLVLPGTNGGWRFYQENLAGINFDTLAGMLNPLRHHTWPQNKKSVWQSYTSEARKRLVSWGEAILEPIMQSTSLDADAMKRLHVYAHILSLLYAWSDRKAVMIERPHVEAAISIITVSKHFLQALLDTPDEADPPPFKRYEIALEQKIMALVQATPGITRREVVRKLAGRTAKSSDINTLISQLIELGRLMQKMGETTAQGGRPSHQRFVVV
jgi:hypothetical protein